MQDPMPECPKCRMVLSIIEENGEVYYHCAACGYKQLFPNWVDHECQKCGFGKAQLLFYGIIVGDEAPLSMYKCLKCGSVVRDGFS
jgi:DNA-directed RNA polymerase subunit M/transcription elongation factor TFIIS